MCFYNVPFDGVDGEGAGLFEDDPVDSVFEEHRAIRTGELSHRDGTALWCVTTEVHVTGDPVNRKALRVWGTCRERGGAVNDRETEGCNMGNGKLQNN